VHKKPSKITQLRLSDFGVHLQIFHTRFFNRLRAGGSVIEITLSGEGGGGFEEYIKACISPMRICFEWLDGDVYNVEIVDYH
jgi:hypothetical protein